MKLRHVFTVNAVICLLYGAPFVAVPALQLSLYGTPPNGLGLLVARLFGAALLAIGAIHWKLRTMEDTEIARATALAFCVTDALGAAVFAQAVLAGDVNALGWSVVAIYAFNAIAFGVCSRAPVAAPAHG